MMQFDYATGTVNPIIVPLTHSERHELIISPISIHHYGGRSFCGHYSTSDHDSAHARYLRAWRRQQQASGSDYIHSNGYLP